MKRAFALASLGLAIVSLAAACGGADPTATPRPAATATSRPRATTAPATTVSATATPTADGGLAPTATRPPATSTPAPAATPPPVSTLAPTATASATLRRGGNLKWLLRDSVATYSFQPTLRNPGLGPQQLWASFQIFQNIMWNDPYNNHRLEGYLVDKWDYNATADQITFHLRPDARWADRTPVTARDLKFNLDQWITPPQGYTVNATIRSIVASMAGTELVDDMTLRVKLKAPDVSVLSLFADYQAMILPAHRTLEQTMKGPLGSGAFQLKDITTDIKFTFARNPTTGSRDPRLRRYLTWMAPRAS